MGYASLVGYCGVSEVRIPGSFASLDPASDQKWTTTLPVDALAGTRETERLKLVQKLQLVAFVPSSSFLSSSIRCFAVCLLVVSHESKTSTFR